MATYTYRKFFYLLGAVSLAACQSSAPPPSGNVKIGKPYVIEGKMYYPEYDNTYDRVGTASWYGPGFHGKYTANGELFDQNDLTAAHPTLPMPSLVRVTNLQSGKSAIIRVNDRGPFKDNRIIDLSKRSAERLGVVGLSKVRVQFLQHETEEYLAAIRGGQKFDMVAYNDRPAEARIVETVNNSSFDSNQDVVEAAPVMSVNSKETIVAQEIAPTPQPVALQGASDAAAVNEIPSTAEAAPGNQGVISEAWADDNVSLPEPKEAAPAAGGSPEPVAVSSSGQYTIQAGSFSEEKNAYKLVKKLSPIAHTVVHNVESAGKTWWRVRVGAFEDRQSAEIVLAKVQSAGVSDARITKK